VGTIIPDGVMEASEVSEDITAGLFQSESFSQTRFWKEVGEENL
jgi:hypothetical protein